MNLTVVHHIPGRIRWRSANCFTRSLAETIAEKLDAITGVEGVRVSPRCGSILITYSTEKGLLSAVDALAGIRTERLQAAYNYDLLLARLLEAAGISDEYPSYARRNDAHAVLFDGSRSGN